MFKKVHPMAISSLKRIDTKALSMRANIFNCSKNFSNSLNNSNNNVTNNSNNNVSNNSNNNVSKVIVTEPTFNILVATIGRNTLEDLIESLSDQLKENDCLTIVFDNNTIREIKNIDKLKCKVNIFNETQKLGHWGHGIRNKYARLLERKDFVLHADDDDTYFPDSFDRLRKECVNKHIIYIAKMVKDKGVYPSDRVSISLGNIGTPCGIIPYNYNREGKWEYFYGGDCMYYVELIKKFKMYKRLNIFLYNVGNTKDNMDYVISSQSQPTIVSA